MGGDAMERKMRWLRLAVPAVLLSVCGALAFLWFRSPLLYAQLVSAAGVSIGKVPFLDMESLTSAIECHHRGIDVYRANPCDVVALPFVYSPFWLDVAPGFLRAQDAVWLGAALDLLFIAALPFILRPRSLAEAGIFALAATSTMVVYALERGNIDIIVFLLIAAAGILHSREVGRRAPAYALCLLGAFLKYYPLCALILLMRERGRRFVIALGAVLAALLGFIALYGARLPEALGNVPHAASLFTDAFSARNLPAGIAQLLPNVSPAIGTVVAAAVLALLLVAGASRVRRVLRLLGPADRDGDGREATHLLLGGTLLVTCFFAGDNVGYRGTLFLLVLPGLVARRRAADDPALRRWLAQMTAAIVILMWGECLRRGVYALVAAVATPWLTVRLELLFWLGREWLWWWVIAGLAALLLAAIARAPLMREVGERIQHWRSTAPSRP
jgi:hypothetical protein